MIKISDLLQLEEVFCKQVLISGRQNAEIYFYGFEVNCVLLGAPSGSHRL